ncbi:MAG: hypothetical protein JNJ42_05070 [Burkholderiaceae bacterium]|nr:hypothetical protein [Burkholderiaceae bacterium]
MTCLACVRAAIVAGATVLAASAALAQQALTLYGGVRTGSGFETAGSQQTSLELASRPAASLALELPYDGSRQLQWFASHQRTRLDLGATAAVGTPSELPLELSVLHFGGVNWFDGPVGRGPYVSGGLGLTHLTPRLPGTSSRTRASMSVGIGWQWAAASQVALRSELRGYATLIRSDGAFFCSGGCTVSIRGDTLVQIEAMVGLTLGF